MTEIFSQGTQIITVALTDCAGATIPSGVVGEVVAPIEGGYLVRFHEAPYSQFGTCQYDDHFRPRDAISLLVTNSDIDSAMQSFARLAED